ncbi:MAG TPA: DoxX family protein [Actinocrinis sp.]
MRMLESFRRLDRHALSVYRIVIGLLMACHGASTLFGVFGGPLGHGTSISPFHWPGGTAALIQLVCGVLVLAGLATRPAAVLCSGAMAYAYFTVHQPHALLPIENGGEPAAMFSWAFLMVAILGPGPLSLDAMIKRMRGSDTGSDADTTADAAAAA